VQAIVAENQQMPSQVKEIILELVARLGGGKTMQAVPDFSAIAKEKGLPPAMVPQIEQAAQPIIATIRQHVTNGFSDVFPWAAGIVFVGIIPALFIRRPRVEVTQSASYQPC
jgi:hypothetical protein